MFPRLALAVALCATQPVQSADLALRDLNGQPRSLADYRGKLVVVNFWATWCVPCKHEMPLFVKANKDYAAKDVVIVAVTTDDHKTFRHVPKFVKKHKMKELEVWVGSDTDMAALGAGEALPATVFIDRDGTIVSRVVGQIKEKDLEDRLQWLTGNRAGPAPAAYVDNLTPAK